MFDRPTAGTPTPERRPPTRLGFRIYEQIKERLLDGRYAAGERLSVDGLKTEFGVSKQPVMDALRRLAGDGLIEIIPQVGCRITTYSADEVTDFFGFFGEVEAIIAEVAATRRTDMQLVQLRAVSGQIGLLLAEPDPGHRAHRYRVLNRQFHAIIHDMARSRIMAEMSRRMWDLSDFLINTTQLAGPLDQVLDVRHADHERIRDALTNRDGPAARTEMARHILGALAS